MNENLDRFTTTRKYDVQKPQIRTSVLHLKETNVNIY